MAMTNALNYVVEKYISELFLYQMQKQTVSSPAFVNGLIYLHDLKEHLASVQPREKVAPPITTREQLMLISAFFGFSKSKLGLIFDVSRQAIYDWYNNVEPVQDHYEKIKRLADVAFEVDPKPSQQIFHVYANEVREGYERSLFDYLRDDDFDKDTVVRLSRTLYEMSKERWERIDAMPKAKYGQNDPTILENNLGFFKEERLGMG